MHNTEYKKQNHSPKSCDFMFFRMQLCITSENDRILGTLPYLSLIHIYNEIYQNRPVVTYCGSGVTACNALLTMSEVGLESALYVGSSSDWVTYDGFPLNTGVETLN